MPSYSKPEVILVSCPTSSDDNVKSLPDLKSEPFIGMWKDREDMEDSTAGVRNVRKEHWGK